MPSAIAVKCREILDWLSTGDLWIFDLEQRNGEGRNPCVPEWRNGRRRGFKIPRLHGRESSSLSSGTSRTIVESPIARDVDDLASVRAEFLDLNLSAGSSRDACTAKFRPQIASPQTASVPLLETV